MDVVDVPEQHRYELRDGDTLVGFAEYRRTLRRIVFTHTEIDQARREQGLGTQLVAEALADARRQELEIVPVCPFVKRFVALEH